MKHMKKFMALFAALALVLTMAIPAMAAKVDVSSHTFEAYQIFTGTMENGKMKNVNWGANIDQSTILSDLTAAFGGEFNASMTAAQAAEAISKWASGSDNALKLAKLIEQKKTGSATYSGTGKVTVAQTGYYLIVDTTVTSSAENSAKNLSLLAVTEANEEVKPSVKGEYPTVEKKVKDKNDSDNSTSDWHDSADHDIGDWVDFQLTGTVPSAENYSAYSTYKYVFHDTQSNGLSFDKDSVKVYYQNSDETTRTEIVAGNYNIETPASDSHTFDVSFTNLKSISAIKGGAKIIVEYRAQLNSNAVIGSTGNPNEVKLEYSNNPNNGGEGETGYTPVDKVIVFTYKVFANKVDQNGQDLAGAAFALYKKLPDGSTTSGENIIDHEGCKWKLVAEINKGENGEVANKNQTTFEWKGVDDGTYLVREIITPKGYNSIPDQMFTISASHDETNANPSLTSLTAIAATGSTITFNRLTGAAEEDALKTTIENRVGATLPSTGGIGTTIFYVIGGGLMVAAAVLLVTKKRMENK